MAVIPDDSPVRWHFLLPGDIVSILISLISLPAIAIFAVARLPKDGQRCTTATLLCLVCYGLDTLYIITVTMLVHIRAPQTLAFCDSMMVLCLALHNSAKAVEIAFLIERAYIISWPVNPRHRTFEYVASSACIFVPYIAVTAVAITYRISYLLGNEVCIIGMQRFALMPMLGVETASQLYLTLRFVQPLLKVHQDGSGLLSPVRKIVIRTSIGCAITMLLDVGVKVSLTLFNGEPVWLCYLTCKAEVFLTAAVLFWITQPVITNDIDGHQELGIGFEDSRRDSATIASHTDIEDTCRRNFVKKVLAFPHAYEPKIPPVQGEVTK